MDRPDAAQPLEKGDQHASVTGQRGVAKSSRHTMLRSATTAVHCQIDQGVRAAGFFDSLMNYTDYIGRMYRFQRNFDAASTAICDEWLTRWRIPQRTLWLAGDVSALGYRPNSETAAAGSPLLSFANPSALLGALYVLAGACLGARILVIRANELCPSIGGVHYLIGLGHSMRWADFLAFLEAQPSISEIDMCNGALATFECVAHCLSVQITK